MYKVSHLHCEFPEIKCRIVWASWKHNCLKTVSYENVCLKLAFFPYGFRSWFTVNEPLICFENAFFNLCTLARQFNTAGTNSALFKCIH